MASLVLLGGAYLTDRIATHRRNKRNQHIAPSSSHHDEKLAAAQHDLNSSYAIAKDEKMANGDRQTRKTSLVQEKQDSVVNEKEVATQQHPAYRGQDVEDSGSDTEVEMEDGQKSIYELDGRSIYELEGEKQQHLSQRPQSVRGNSHGTIGKAL